MLIQKPTPRVLSALASLQGQPDFEAVMRWIDESKQDLVRSSMESKDEVLTRWSQGAYQALDFITDYASRSRDIIRGR